MLESDDTRQERRKTFLNMLGFVAGAPNRKVVLLALDRPRSPKDVAQRSKLGMNLASRSLREMEKYGLVVCETPARRKGRIYRRTGAGERVARECVD